MFFAFLFAPLDSSPFEMIDKYLDDGQYSLPTGIHTVDNNGQQVTYGPVLSFTKSSHPNLKVIAFSEPKPKSSIGHGCQAVVDRIEFEPGGATYGVGNFHGISQRKLLKWGD